MPRKGDSLKSGRLKPKQVIGNPTERHDPERRLIKKMSPNRKTKTQTIKLTFGTINQKPKRKTCPRKETR